jgi:hypothetical protein
MGARHGVGIGLLYRPARLHRLAEFIPWNRFRGPIHVQKYQLRFLSDLHPKGWQSSEYTQSGKSRFLAFTITRADTLPVFHFYPVCTQWF